MNKKIKNNLFKLLIVVFLIIYLLYSSDTINELKASVKEVSKNVNIEEINQKNFRKLPRHQNSNFHKRHFRQQRNL